MPLGHPDLTADSGARQCDSEVRAPEEAASLQATATRRTKTRLRAEPEHRTRISVQKKARWADRDWREHAQCGRTYRWQHVVSGRIVSRTRLEMREEHGLRPDSLDSLVAGRIQSSRGWRLAPRSLLGAGPRWIFPQTRLAHYSCHAARCDAVARATVRRAIETPTVCAVLPGHIGGCSLGYSRRVRPVRK